MKKSKHFRKDVIMARIIAGVILILLIALLVFAVSLFTKPSDTDGQNTQNTQNENSQDHEIETEDTESEVDVETETDSETEEDTDSIEKVYVKTTTQVKLRKEPNTNCETLDRIDGGTKLEVLETLQGWYKVSYNGQIGYVSATYAQIVEE